MRARTVAIPALVAVLAGCIPLGVTSRPTRIVWQEGNARIERREFASHMFIFAPPEPGKTYFLSEEYWWVDDTREERLPHLQERISYDKRGSADRAYLGKIAGDRALERWFFVAHHITARERADVFLMLFDRRKLITTVTLPGCQRFYSIGNDSFSHFGLRYDQEAKAMHFISDAGNGWVDLATGTVRYEPATQATQGVKPES
jgi:hypothetical protein